MKHLLVILLSLCATTSIAQTYQYVPIPTNNAVWKATNEQFSINSGHCAKYQFTIAGSYSVNGSDTFYRINVHSAAAGYNYPNSTPQQAEFVSTCTIDRPFEYPFEAHSAPGTLWMIEKNKRIYILDSPVLDTSVHTVALDFNIDSVGQVVFMAMGAYQDSVVHIDTININGTLRKRFALSNTVWQSIDTLIEGIGSLRFGLGFRGLQAVGTTGRGKGKVFCFSTNGQQEYVYNNSACADIWPLSVDNIYKDKLFLFGPNPFSHQLTVNSPAEGTVRIYNVSGKCVCSHTCSSGEKIIIETSGWQPGVYMAITESKESRNTYKLVKL